MNNSRGAFWDELDKNVQEIQQNTQQKRQMTSQDSRASSRRKIHRFQVEDLYHKELEEQQKIHNRIKFLEIDRQKQKRTLELAKNKYQRLMEIRNQSIKEKQQCKRRIQDMNKQVSRDISTRAQRVRSQKKKISLSIRKIKEKNEYDANNIRSLSVQNEEILKQARKKEEEHKRELVQKMHEEMERSRTFHQKRQQGIEQKGKTEHQAYLEDKLRVNNAQRRKNSVLKQKLHESILHASKDRQHYMGELKQFTSKMNNYSLVRTYNSTMTTIS